MSDTKNQGRIFWGLLLVVLGGLFLFAQMDWWNFGHVVARFWPVIFILLGISMLVANSFKNVGSGVFFILFGTFFLLIRWDVLHTIGRYIWPVAIIVAGLWILLRPARGLDKKKTVSERRRRRPQDQPGLFGDVAQDRIPGFPGRQGRGRLRLGRDRSPRGQARGRQGHDRPLRGLRRHRGPRPPRLGDRARRHARPRLDREPQVGRARDREDGHADRQGRGRVRLDRDQGLEGTAMKKGLFWSLAVVITLGSAVYQRMTGSDVPPERKGRSGRIGDPFRAAAERRNDGGRRSGRRGPGRGRRRARLAPLPDRRRLDAGPVRPRRRPPRRPPAETAGGRQGRLPGHPDGGRRVRVAHRRRAGGLCASRTPYRPGSSSPTSWSSSRPCSSRRRRAWPRSTGSGTRGGSSFGRSD